MTETKKVSFQTSASGMRRSPGNLVLVVEPSVDRRDSHDRIITEPGKRITFEGGVFETTDKDEIKWLREEAERNPHIYEVKEKPRLVVAEADPSDVLREIARAQADKDGDKLASIYAQEAQTHSRQSVLVAAEVALEIVDDRSPDPVPQPEHQLARERVGAVRPSTPGDAPEAGYKRLAPGAEEPTDDADQRIAGDPYQPEDSGSGPGREDGATVTTGASLSSVHAGPETPIDPGSGTPPVREDAKPKSASKSRSTSKSKSTSKKK